MTTALLGYKDEVEYDISGYLIDGHAMGQYSEKCSPGLSLIDINMKMRTKMKNVRRIELNRELRKGRVSFIDEDEIIYITDKGKVVTVFPNKRIFVAKTFYSNKKTGKKYL